MASSHETINGSKQNLDNSSFDRSDKSAPFEMSQSIIYSNSQSPKKMTSSGKDHSKLQAINPQYKKIFVGGLPHNLEEEHFRQYFLRFGEMDDCVIMRDKRTQKPRGFGFITYRDIQSVVSVIDMHDQHYIDSKWIDCKSAIPFEEIKSLEKKQKEEKMNIKIDVEAVQHESHSKLNSIGPKDNFL